MIEIRHSSMNDSSSTQAAYDDYYNSGGVDLATSFYMWLLDKLKPEPGKLLLDISCGRGKLVNIAVKRGVHAIGFDFSIRAILQNPLNLKQSRFLISNGEKAGLISGFADYITHIGNLEHYQDPAAGLREVSRLLKPSGTAMILLPNTFSFFGNLQNVRRTGQVFDDGQPLQRYNTRAGWLNLIESNGLKIYKTIRYERAIPQTRQDWLSYIRKPTHLLRLLLQWVIPFNWSNCFVYFCRRKT